MLIELALADFANDQGSCFPSIETVARKARCSESWVHQVIRDLRNRGRLNVILGGGRGKVNIYVLTPNAGEKGVTNTPLLPEKGAVDSVERVQSDEKRVHPTAPRTVSDPSIEPSLTIVADDPLPFEPKGTVTAVFITEQIAKYPSLNVPEEHDKYVDHWLAHPKNKPKDDQAGLRNWLRKAEGWRNERPQTTGRNTASAGARGAGATADELMAGWEAYARGE